MAEIKVEIKDCDKKNTVTFETENEQTVRDVIQTIAKSLGITVEIPFTRKGGGSG